MFRWVPNSTVSIENKKKTKQKQNVDNADIGSLKSLHSFKKVAREICTTKIIESVCIYG